MGEIVGGIIVMIIFIGFIMLKNKGKNRKPNALRDMHEQEYWANRDSESYDSDDGGDD